MKINYRHLTLICLLGLFTGVFAQSGKSLVLDGTNQYMGIPSHNDFNISTTQDFSITCWIKVASWLDNPQRFVAKRDLTATGNKSGYELWGGVNSTKFYACNTPNAEGSHNNSLSVYSTESGSLNTWVHIGFVVDHTNGKMRIYQNGLEAGNSGTKNIALWDMINTSDVTVGCVFSGSKAGNFFKGEVDNLRFWNKALTTAEMVSDKVATVDDKTTNLIAAYDFEKVVGATVPDISGGTQHPGTLYNYPIKGPAMISAVSLVQDPNFTGRGNDNEVILKTALMLAGTESVACESIKLNMDGTTDISDVESIKIYSTGKVDKFDPRNVSTATLLGTVAPKLGEIVCATTGNFIPGINYLWITYQIKEVATEGHQVDANVLSIVTANETHNLVKTSVEGARTILLTRKLLFAPGDNGSKNYRIPGIITAKDGSLVTVTDKRKYVSTDLPSDIDIVVKRSIDGGKTWSEAQTIAQGTGLRAGFGDAGIVHTNEEGGLLCVFVGGNGMFDGSSPSNPIRTYICKSLDNGVTWTQPKDITNQLFGSGCSVEARKNWYASFCASGNGLLTRNGRIMFVAAVRESSSSTLSNYVFYSDNNGDTWNVSSRAMSAGDESKVVELNNGDILMSIRNLGFGARHYNISKDGGLTWGTPADWNELQGPSCNGDIIRYTSTKDGYEKDRILHTIPYNYPTRRNVSLFLSYDEGKTWPINKTLCDAESAYSSLTILPDGTIGAYVEENFLGGDANVYSCYYMNFSLNWFTSGTDTYHMPGTVAVASPAFSVPAGRYYEEQAIELSSTTPGASIYYTIDGTTPTVESILYTEPIVVSSTMTIKAIAMKKDIPNSALVTATYTIVTGWATPTGTVHPTESRYITSVTTTQATSNLNFTQSVKPSTVYVKAPNQFSAERGSQFTLNIKATAESKWCHAILFIDWNKDFDFDDEDEQIERFGKDSFEDSSLPTKGNMIVCNIEKLIVVPENATLGVTRMRVQYTDAWHNKSVGHTHSGDDVIDKGGVYDFDFEIKEKQSYAVTFSQPEMGGTFKVKNGEEEVSSGDQIPSGTILTIVVEPAKDYKVSSIKVNEKVIEGTTFTVTENSNIAVAFSNVVVSLKKISAEDLVVYINKDDKVVIQGAPIGSSVEIYNTIGRLVNKSIIASESEIISGIDFSESIYLVKVSNDHDLVVRKIMRM